MTKLTDAIKKPLIEKYGKEQLRVLEIPTTEAHKEVIEVAVVIPSRNVFGQYMKWADVNPKKSQEILVRGCVLTSREQIEADDFMFNTVVSLLAELIPIGQGNIKKF